MEFFFCLYKIVLHLFFQLLYSDLFLFVTYLFDNLFKSRKLLAYIVQVTKKILMSDLYN